MKIVGKRHVECQVNFADVLDAVSHKKRELFEDCRTVATFSCSIGILPGPKNAAETAALQGRCSPLHATFNSSPSAAPCSLGGLSKRGGHPRVALSSEGFLVVDDAAGRVGGQRPPDDDNRRESGVEQDAVFQHFEAQPGPAGAWNRP